MSQGAPVLQELTHRLADTPPEILEEPRIHSVGKVPVHAVVHDLLEDLGGAPDPAELSDFTGRGLGRRNKLRLVLITSWLLHHRFFRDGAWGIAVLRFLKTGLDEIAQVVDAELFVTDPDRREELVRRLLAALELRPEGETEAQAADRLGTLDSVEQHRVIQEAKEAERKAREIREAMRRKAAAEAAAKASRE